MVWNLSNYLPKKSNVYFGYHRGDDFWRFCKEAEQGLKSLLLVGEREAEIKYPLETYWKWEIVEELEKRGIPNNCIWSCEKPIIKRGKVIACGKCDPCLRLKLAKIERDLRSE